MVIYPILALILTTGLLLGVTTLGRRRGLAPLLGIGAVFSVLGLALLLSPVPWRSALVGGEKGDRLLTMARDVGLTGLFFLAGLRSKLRESWKLKRVLTTVAGMAAALGAVIAILYRFFTHGQEAGVFVVLMAGLVSASVGASDWNWKRDGETSASLAGVSLAVSMALTGVALTAIYFYAVFESLPSAAVSGSALAINVAYETLKIVMLFSFAYFAATRFLARAEKRLSEFRQTVAYLLLAALLFVLMLMAADILAAVAWSFLAGAIGSQFSLGRKLGQHARPIAEPVLWACALLPPLLQTHGRSLTGMSIHSFVTFLILALAIKYLALRFSLRLSGLPPSEAGPLAFLNLPSGESAILILGFGVTRWSLDGPLYFSVLGFAAISMILGPALGKWVMPRKFSITGHATKILLIALCLAIGIRTKLLDAASDNIGAAPNSAFSSQARMDLLLQTLRQDVDSDRRVGFSDREKAEWRVRLP